MSTIARLEVIPTRGANMSEAVASAVGALDRFDVSYETTPTDTVIEADDPGEVFAAAEAAHRAVADERVITSLEVDEHRTRRQDRHDRVASVERALGRPPERERRSGGMQARQQGPSAEGMPESGAGETELRRYHGPVSTDQQGSSRSARGTSTETRQTGTQSAGTQQTGTGQTGTRQTGTQQTETRQTGTRSTGSRQAGSRYLQSRQSPPR